MTRSLIFAISLSALVFGCSQDTTQYRSAVTGELCEPDISTIQAETDEPKKAKKYCAKSNNGHGNNEDGVDSSNPGGGSGGPNGELDQSCDGTGECIDDEMKKGPGDAEGECELPPGCDEDLCCDGGDDGGGDDGGGDDGGGDDGGDDGGGDDGGGDDGGGDDGGGDDGGGDDGGGDDGGGDDGGGDDGGGDGGDGGGDGGGYDGDICTQTCVLSSECGNEAVCTNGCCEVYIK